MTPLVIKDTPIAYYRNEFRANSTLVRRSDQSKLYSRVKDLRLADLASTGRSIPTVKNGRFANLGLLVHINRREQTNTITFTTQNRPQRFVSKDP